MGGEIRTLSDCIGLLQAAVHQAPLGQDVRLKTSLNVLATKGR
jgi:hypothetical protein